MDTGRMSLIITLESDCSSVRFRGECDGEATEEQSALTAAIYAAVTDITQDSETYTYYLQLADSLAEEEERVEKRKHLKLIH